MSLRARLFFVSGAALPLKEIKFISLDDPWKPAYATIRVTLQPSPDFAAYATKITLIPRRIYTDDDNHPSDTNEFEDVGIPMLVIHKKGLFDLFNV